MTAAPPRPMPRELTPGEQFVHVALWRALRRALYADATDRGSARRSAPRAREESG